jgi:hypothetical protein
MKKEFIVLKIEAPDDGSLDVYVVLADTKANFTATGRQERFPENHFGIAAIPITSLDDLKNLPKKISDAIEGTFSGSSRKNMSSPEPTIFKMKRREYEELGIKPGDKINLEITISNDNEIGA